MYPEQRSNSFPLQCQADFYPLCHHGSPWSLILKPGLCLDPKSYRAAFKVNSHKTMIHHLVSKTHLSLSCPSRTLCKKYTISRGTPQICSSLLPSDTSLFLLHFLPQVPFKNGLGFSYRSPSLLTHLASLLTHLASLPFKKPRTSMKQQFMSKEGREKR